MNGTYEVSRGRLFYDLGTTIGTCLLSSVSIKPLTKAAVTECMSTRDGVRFIQRTNTDPTGDQRPEIFQVCLQTL